MLGKIITAITLLSAVGLIYVLNTTTPTSTGPFGVLIFFVLSYFTSLGVTTLLLYVGSRGAALLSKTFGLRKPLRPLTTKRAYYYSTVVGLAPILLIGLQSVGAVSIYELLLVALFVAIGCLYIAKRT